MKLAVPQFTHANYSKKWVAAAIGALFQLLVACVAAPANREVERLIVTPTREVELSDELGVRLKKAYGSWIDPASAQYMGALVRRLVASDSSYRNECVNVRIELLATTLPLAAAGLDKVIYISKGMTTRVRYENELAFILATQLAVLRSRAVLRNLASHEGQEISQNLIRLPTAPPASQRDLLERDWFEPGGLFDIGSIEYLRAESDAVRLIYAAHFDPRGAVSYIERLGEEGNAHKAVGKIMPEIDDRLRLAREEVAKLSPLRDPVVKSAEFAELQSRLQEAPKKRNLKIKRAASGGKFL